MRVRVGDRSDGLHRALRSPLLTAAVVRLVVAFGLLGSVPIASDASAYVAQARDWMADGWTRAFFWPPGTSAYLLPWLAVFSDTDGMARLACVALSLVAVPAAAGLAAEITDDPRAPRVVAWIVALYPQWVLLASMPHSHALSAVGLVVAMLGWLRARRGAGLWWAVVAGLGLGAAGLARPSNALVLVVPAIVGLAWWRQSGRPPAAAVRSVAVAGFVALVMVAPFVLSNIDHDGGPVIDGRGEEVFFYGNNRFTPLYETARQGQQGLDDFGPEERAYIVSLRDEPDPGHAYVREAVSYIGDRPDLFAVRSASRLRALFGPDYFAARMVQEEHGRLGLVAVAPFEAAGWILFAGAVIVGVVTAGRRVLRGPSGWVLGVVAAHLAPYLVTTAAPIYHHAAIGLLAPFAALGMLAVADGGAAVVRRRPVLLALAGFAVLQVEFVLWYSLA